MKISIKKFDGETPRLTDNLLSATDAQTALNCKLEKGDLRSWNQAALEEDLTDTTIQTLYEYASAFITEAVDVDYVRSPIADDQYDRLYYTGKDEPRVHCNDIEMPGYYKLGVPAATIQLSTEITAAGTGSSESRIYSYTWVTKYGEEGPPSAVGTLLTANDDATVDVTNIQAHVSDRAIETIRLYRTAVDTENFANFYFVKDYTLPTVEGEFTGTADNGEYYWFDEGNGDVLFKCINDGTTADPDDPVNGVGGSGTDHWEYYTLTDDVDTADLDGDICPSETWLPPPTGLTGIIGLPNGMIAGFESNEIFFCEPYLPHAWPDTALKSQYQVIGLGLFGTTIVVLTDGKPFLIVGDAPETMIQIPLADHQPCASKRSIVSAKLGVIYASNEGLIFINQDGLRNLTFQNLTLDNWKAIVPASLQGYFFGEKYFGFNSSSGTSFIYEIVSGNYTQYSDIIYAGYVSIGDGKFYIIINEPETVNNPDSGQIKKIKEWEGDSYNLERYTWKSKKFVLPGVINLGAAKVALEDSFYDTLLGEIGDESYFENLNNTMIANNALNGAIGESDIGTYAIGGDALHRLDNINMVQSVTFKMYVDGGNTAKFTKQVLSSKPFKLPGTTKYRSVELELSGNIPVDSLEVATSIKELI